MTLPRRGTEDMLPAMLVGRIEGVAGNLRYFATELA